MGECSEVLPHVVHIYTMDNDATDLSSDEEGIHQGEKSKQQKKICKEIIIKMERPRSLQRWYPPKRKKIQNCTKKI